MVRNKVLNDIQQGLTIQPIEFKKVHVRATFEFNTAQANLLLCNKGLSQNGRVTPSTSDGWTRDSVSVAATIGSIAVPTPLASLTTGTTWELNLERFRNLDPHVDVEAIQTLFLDA